MGLSRWSIQSGQRLMGYVVRILSQTARQTKHITNTKMNSLERFKLYYEAHPNEKARVKRERPVRKAPRGKRSSK